MQDKHYRASAYRGFRVEEYNEYRAQDGCRNEAEYMTGAFREASGKRNDRDDDQRYVHSGDCRQVRKTAPHHRVGHLRAKHASVSEAHRKHKSAGIAGKIFTHFLAQIRRVPRYERGYAGAFPGDVCAVNIGADEDAVGIAVVGVVGSGKVRLGELYRDISGVTRLQPRVRAVKRDVQRDPVRRAACGHI